MEYKYEYKDEEERDSIISSHADLFLREEWNIADGNFLIFVDAETNMQNQIAEELSSRVSDVSTYLSSLDATTITDMESSILEIEKNKIINGGI